MASKYLIAAGGTWTADTSWSTTDGGANDTTKPTAADDVFLTSNSGQCTISAAAVGRSLNCTGYTNVLTHNSGIALSLGDGTAGASNIALKLVAGMTYTLGSATTSNITFVSSSATVQTIDYGTKTNASISFISTGKYAFTSGITMAGQFYYNTATTVQMDGTADNSGLTHSIGAWFSDSGTKTLTLGTAIINCSGAWDMGNTTGLTLNANTSVINMTGASPTFSVATSAGTAKIFYAVNFTGSGTPVANIANSTFNTFTRTGTAVKTDGLTVNSFSGNPIIVTGTLTFTGNSSVNRLLINQTTLGTSALFTTTGATVTATNTDFRDITLSVTKDLSAQTDIGDCGGNSGITFPAAVTQTYTGGTDSWSTAARWTSRVPLPQDNILMSGVTGGTVTADMPRLGKSIDWTGAAGSPTWAVSTAPTIYGSVTLISAMTFTLTVTITFEGRGAFTLTSAGNSFANNAVIIQMVGGSLTLQDAFVMSGASATLTLNNGTFNDGGFTSTMFAFSSSNALTRVITISGTLTLAGTGTVWTTATATNLTVTATGSTISITDTSATSKTFAGGGKTYNNILISGGGSGAVIFTGANTFNRIYTNGGGTKTITLPGSTTTTLISGSGLANGTNVITFGASAGSATVSKSSGTLSWNYVSLTNIPSTGGATFYAGANSTDGGGNTGWIFTNAPAVASGTGYGLGRFGFSRFGRNPFGLKAFNG